MDNPARPAAGVLLCKFADLADPGAKGFVFRRAEMLFAGFVIRKGGEVFGFVDRCPHAGLPLAGFGDRFLTRPGEEILCANHGALFRLEDGLCVAGPCAGAHLQPWPVHVLGGAVVVA